MTLAVHLRPRHRRRIGPRLPLFLPPLTPPATLRATRLEFPVHCGGSGAEHATRATCAPPLGMPSHSIAEADDPKQTGGRIPSASTTEGAAASSGFPLDPRSFSVMLTLGPREVLLPVRSSPGWELFTPVQGALLARADPRPRSGTISGCPRPGRSAGSHLTAIPQPGLAPVWPR